MCAGKNAYRFGSPIILFKTKKTFKTIGGAEENQKKILPEGLPPRPQS